MEKTINVYLTRLRRSDQGTEGILMVPELGFSCYTLELPWRDNKPNVSCIPPGTYPLIWRVGRRWSAYHIQHVPGRSFILHHSGNYAGDKSKGWKSHVEGCVLGGSRMGWLSRQRAVLNSRATVRKFNTLMAKRRGRITIMENWKEAA